MSRINGFIGRRHFLMLTGTASLAMAAGGCNLVIGKEQASADAESTNLNPVNSQQALKLLVDGNQRFVNGIPKYPHQSRGRLQAVAKAQYPFAAILGCADSRVPAEIIFDQGLGDLFVVRVAGNVASDMAIASLEYATSVLDTRLIVVLGHESCGAVAAAMKKEPLPGKLGYMVEDIKPALKKVKRTNRNFAQAAIIANIQYQAERLKQKSNIIQQLITQGKVKIVGAAYNLSTGKVSIIS